MPPLIRTTLRDARPRRRSLSSEPGVLLLANIMVISVTASATLAAVRARPPRARAPAAAASREGPRLRSRCVPARRRVTAAAAEEDPLVENVERAAGLLDLIIKETVEQVFVEEAVEEVIPGEDDADADAAASPSSAPAAEVDKEAILRSVVRKHLGELDGSFMAALSAYVQVAESSGTLRCSRCWRRSARRCSPRSPARCSPTSRSCSWSPGSSPGSSAWRCCARRTPAAGPWPGWTSRRRPSKLSRRSPRGWSTRWNRRSASPTGSCCGSCCWSARRRGSCTRGATTTGCSAPRSSAGPSPRARFQRRRRR